MWANGPPITIVPMNIRRSPNRSRLSLSATCLVVLAFGALALASPAPVNAAKAKLEATAKKAPTTTTKPGAESSSADLLAGTWRWVDSRTSVGFRDGTVEVADVKPVPGSTLKFTRQKSGAGQVFGIFSGTDFQGNPMNGSWRLQPGGVLQLTFNAGEDTLDLLRSLTVTRSRLVMTANDRQVAAQFEKFVTDGPKDVIGGSSYDELVRVK